MLKSDIWTLYKWILNHLTDEEKMHIKSINKAALLNGTEHERGMILDKNILKILSITESKQTDYKYSN